MPQDPVSVETLLSRGLTFLLPLLPLIPPVCDFSHGCQPYPLSAGFYGANSWETAKIDEIVGVVEDLWLPVIRIIFGEEDKAAQVCQSLFKKAKFCDPS